MSPPPSRACYDVEIYQGDKYVGDYMFPDDHCDRYPFNVQKAFDGYLITMPMLQLRVKDFNIGITHHTTKYGYVYRLDIVV